MFVRACVQEKERETIGTDKTFTISPLDPALVSLSLVHRDRNGKEKTGSFKEREREIAKIGLLAITNKVNWTVQRNHYFRLYGYCELRSARKSIQRLLDNDLTEDKKSFVTKNCRPISLSLSLSLSPFLLPLFKRSCKRRQPDFYCPDWPLEESLLRDFRFLSLLPR